MIAASTMPTSKTTASVFRMAMTIVGIIRKSLSSRVSQAITTWNGSAAERFNPECWEWQSTAHSKDADVCWFYSYSSLNCLRLRPVKTGIHIGPKGLGVKSEQSATAQAKSRHVDRV